MRDNYKEARRILRSAIQEAKYQSWQELVASIDANPWGRPYLLVLGRLKRASPGLTEILEEEELHPLMDSLFTSGIGSEELSARRVFEWTEDLVVRPAEVLTAIWKKRYSNTAPGLDSIRSVVWRKTPRAMMVKLSECFTVCLRDGAFPNS